MDDSPRTNRHGERARFAVFLLVLIATWKVAGRTAHACNHVCTNWPPKMIMPEADATDIPLDAEIKLRWDGPGVSNLEGLVELVQVNGAVVSTTEEIDYWKLGFSASEVLHPSALLAPSTTYQIRLLVPIADTVSVGYFTTGTTTADTGPVLPPGDNSHTLYPGDTRLCGHDDVPMCCEPAPVLDIGFAPGVQGGPRTRTYTIREGDNVIARNLIGSEDGMVECETGTYFDCGYGDVWYRWILPPGTHTLTVEAVDLAGHVSTPVVRTIDFTCGALPPDAGVANGVDAGTGGGSPAGCGCRAGRGVAEPLTLAVVVGLRVRRRSRRCRSAATARC